MASPTRATNSASWAWWYSATTERAACRSALLAMAGGYAAGRVRTVACVQRLQRVTARVACIV